MHMRMHMHVHVCVHMHVHVHACACHARVARDKGRGRGGGQDEGMDTRLVIGGGLASEHGNRRVVLCNLTPWCYTRVTQSCLV